MLSLDNAKIPASVRLHFNQLALDSNNQLIPKPITVRNGKEYDRYELIATFHSGKVVGTIEKTSYINICPECQTQEPLLKKTNEKHLKLKVPAKFCCSTHIPNHCVNTEMQVQDTSAKYGCLVWKVVIYN